jgi:hypothetical protein
MKNFAVRVAVFGLALSTLGSLTGCASVFGSGFLPTSGEVILDTTLVEQEITDGIATQLGVEVIVECPSVMKGAPGDTRNCVATAFDGSVVRVVVVFENELGDITWYTE